MHPTASEPIAVTTACGRAGVTIAALAGSDADDGIRSAATDVVASSASESVSEPPSSGVGSTGCAALFALFFARGGIVYFAYYYVVNRKKVNETK